MKSWMKAVLRVHTAVYQRTNGWLGHHLVVVPCLLLRTTGRRSGLRRDAVLAYGRDAGRYLVVASNNGQDAPPAWLHNIRATPEVDLLVGHRQVRAVASEVHRDDPDFERLWDIVNRVNRGGYRRYQERTTRSIPVVVLTPSG